MAILELLKKDVRVVTKHFQKRFQGVSFGDLLLNGIAIGLIGTLGATAVLQRDITLEAIEKVSPFRYHLKQNIWHVIGMKAENQMTGLKRNRDRTRR